MDVKFGSREYWGWGCGVARCCSPLAVIAVIAPYLFSGFRLSVAMRSSCYMLPWLGFRMLPYLASSGVMLKLVSSSEGANCVSRARNAD